MAHAAQFRGHGLTRPPESDAGRSVGPSVAGGRHHETPSFFLTYPSQRLRRQPVIQISSLSTGLDYGSSNADDDHGEASHLFTMTTQLCHWCGRRWERCRRLQRNDMGSAMVENPSQNES